MKHISLAIPDNKYQFFLELIEDLSFVEVEDDEEKIAMEELQNSFHQVKLMQEGKIPKQTAEDFLRELAPKRLFINIFYLLVALNNLEGFIGGNRVTLSRFGLVVQPNIF